MVSALLPFEGPADLSRIEAPVTLKAYLICAFAACGGLCKSEPHVLIAQSQC